MSFMPPESQALAKVNGCVTNYYNAITTYKRARALQQPDPTSPFHQMAKDIKQELADAGVTESRVSMVFSSTLQRQNATGPIVDHLSVMGLPRQAIVQILGDIAVTHSIRSLRMLFRQRDLPLPDSELLQELFGALKENRRSIDMAMLDILEKEDAPPARPFRSPKHSLRRVDQLAEEYFTAVEFYYFHKSRGGNPDTEFYDCARMIKKQLRTEGVLDKTISTIFSLVMQEYHHRNLLRDCLLELHVEQRDRASFMKGLRHARSIDDVEDLISTYDIDLPHSKKILAYDVMTIATQQEEVLQQAVKDISSPRRASS